MRFLILIACLWAVTNGSPLDSSSITTFEQFKSVFNKRYSSAAEEAIRRDNFYRSLQWIKDNSGKHGIEFGINELSDMSEQEFQGSKMGPRTTEDFYANPVLHVTPEHNLPSHFDWKAKLGPIEHQGKCGGCWAFSSLAAVEAAFSIKHNVHVTLSKQELIDCTMTAPNSAYHNHGCHGGVPQTAFKYVVERGILEQQYYPYKAAPNESCYTSRVASSHKRYHINGYHSLAFNVDDASLMTVLKQHGPVSVDIYAHNDVFKHYKSGIIRGLLPHSKNITHAVALVGWGNEHGVDYWILRNSWGPHWGEQGYARVERHNCLMGMCNYASFPVLN